MIVSVKSKIVLFLRMSLTRVEVDRFYVLAFPLSLSSLFCHLTLFYFSGEENVFIASPEFHLSFFLSSLEQFFFLFPWSVIFVFPRKTVDVENGFTPELAVLFSLSPGSISSTCWQHSSMMDARPKPTIRQAGREVFANHPFLPK